MISYAQNLEDVILARALGDVAVGFYVDVGAHDPEFMSVTKSFYDRGWRGVNFEPGLIFEKLAAARPRDVNLNAAASDRSGTATLYEFPDGAGLATLEPGVTAEMATHAAGRFGREVPVVTLRDALAEHAGETPIDFLSVDVEGHEAAVLRGNDWDRFRPRVVMVEATEPMSDRPTHARWEPILTAARYLFAYFDGLNRFYVRAEDAERLARFRLPPHVFDFYTLGAVSKLEGTVAELHGIVADHRRHVRFQDDRLAEARAAAEEWEAKAGALAADAELARGQHAAAIAAAVTEAEALRADVADWRARHAQAERTGRALELQVAESARKVEALAAECAALTASLADVRGELACVRKDLAAARAEAAGLAAVASEYRGLCRGTAGRSLRAGLWLARRLSALRAAAARRPRPPYPV